MTRHDYRHRPAPRREDGRFVPPAPVPMDASIERLSPWEAVVHARHAAANPLLALSDLSMVGFDAVVPLLGTTYFVPTHPDTLRATFVTHAADLRHARLRRAVLRPTLRDGLLTSEGETWRHDRRLLAPLFAAATVERLAPAMAASVARRVDATLAEGPLEVDRWLVDLTYGVLSDVLFSGRIDGGREAATRDIEAFLNTLGRLDPLDVLGAPDWVPRPTRVGRMGVVRRLRATVGAAIAARRREGAARGADGGPVDLLDLLLRAVEGEGAGGTMTEDRLVDQVVTFIGAGHETTSRALTWLFYLLSQDDGARARVEADVDALDPKVLPTAEALPFLAACLDEAMRLYPPAPFVLREIARDVEIEGTALAEGTVVYGNLWAVHRHRRLWDRPDAFVPERFLSPAREGIARFQYLPFGLGPRVCIGAGFARAEAVTIAARVLGRWRLDLDGPHPWPLGRITVRTERPLRMRAARRGR